ncbi:MAG: helix-turn-helix transcriptional regulator [Clostridia bacterium]|nr:helix-turn-helix transcriptional regulator [Clostridia bacterium]
MSKLQEKRKAAGMSQSQLAKASGVGVRMIQNYERGGNDINGARLETLLKFSIALNCSISEIIEGEELADLLRKYKRNKSPKKSKK